MRNRNNSLADPLCFSDSNHNHQQPHGRAGDDVSHASKRSPLRNNQRTPPNAAPSAGVHRTTTNTAAHPRSNHRPLSIRIIAGAVHITPIRKAMENQFESESEDREQSNSHESSTSSQDRHNWITEQDNLREKLITEDNFTWKLPTSTPGISSQELRFVGGVDISFSKDDPSMACGTLVVLDFRTLQVVYQDFSFVTLSVPYVAGFLAFREAPVLLDILEKMKRSDNPFYPQVLMVDGNGILHPRVASCGWSASL